MATAPAQDPKTRVRTSQRLFSEEVGIADAEDVARPKDTAYQFSNGRRFEELTNPYEAPDA